MIGGREGGNPFAELLDGRVQQSSEFGLFVGYLLAVSLGHKKGHYQSGLSC
jgi:hypothetical protein